MDRELSAISDIFNLIQFGFTFLLYLVYLLHLANKLDRDFDYKFLVPFDFLANYRRLPRFEGFIDLSFYSPFVEWRKEEHVNWKKEGF